MDETLRFTFSAVGRREYPLGLGWAALKAAAAAR
jgi:hypothetical protein